MYSIENESLKVVVRSRGAELDSIYNKTQQLEYLWSGDPVFWGKKSPVLFPIVGTQKNDTYFFNDKEYHLSRHGFAREMEFTVSHQDATVIMFTLLSDKETLLKFPFPFRFDITYRSECKTNCPVAYTVTNTGQGAMFFSVGTHPAFKVPLATDTEYEDYNLVFQPTRKTPACWPMFKRRVDRHARPIPFVKGQCQQAAAAQGAVLRRCAGV